MKSESSTIWIAITLTLVAPAAGLAGSNFWTPAGPDGGVMKVIATDPTSSAVLYAAVDSGGIWKSTDAGAGWELTNGGLPASFELSVNVVRLDPTDSTDIFIATGNDGVYRSTDSGSTWKMYCDDTLDDQAITDLLPFPATNTVFAASAGLYESATTRRPMLAAEIVNDFEQSAWDNLLDAFGRLEMKYPHTIRGLVGATTIFEVRPAPNSETIPRLYVASLDNGLAVSTDGAASWSFANTGLASMSFEALDVDRGHENVVYTGGQGDGIYKTTNAGSSWSPSTHGLEASAVNALAVAPSNSAVIYAGLNIVCGIRVSTDGGLTWSIANGSPNVLGNLTVTSIATDPANPSIVYVTADGAILFASTVSRVYKSTDSGTSWKEQPAATGLLPIPEMIAIDPTNPSNVYVTTNGNSVYRTTDGGATWAAANNDGGSGFFTDGAVHALAIDPAHPGTLYAGADFRAVWKTTNGGALWVNLADGLEDAGGYVSPVAIVIDPADSSTIYLAANGRVGDPSLIGVFVSHDSGNSWTQMNTGLTNFNATSLAIAPPPMPSVAGGLGVSPIRRVGGRS